MKRSRLSRKGSKVRKFRLHQESIGKWEPEQSTKTVKTWVFDKKKIDWGKTPFKEAPKAGLFLGGDEYASSVLFVKRRGTGRFWEVFVIGKDAKSYLLAEKTTKPKAMEIAKAYMKFKKTLS